MGPQSLTNLFTYKGDMTYYNLRNISSMLCLPKPRSNYLKKSFMNDGLFLCNCILKEISWPNIVLYYYAEFSSAQFVLDSANVKPNMPTKATYSKVIGKYQNYLSNIAFKNILHKQNAS